jgi:lipopolysaccharide export system permease protein
MKKIIYRNLFKDCFIFFLIALSSSAIIIWVFQAVSYLDLMIEDGRDFLVYLNYTLLNFPKILTKLIPFVIFFSIFYTISKYEDNNELMILWNIGINKIRLVNFFLKISIIIIILQLFLTILLVPTFQNISRDLIRSSELSFGESLFKPKKFNDTIKNLTIYIDDKDQNNFLEYIYIKKDIDQNSFQVTFAKKGKFIKKGNNNVLELYEGETINKNDNKISNFSFSKSDFYFLESETGILEFNKIQEMTTLDMFACLNNIKNLNLKILKNIKVSEDNKHNCNINGIENIYKELYKRFLLPFYIPILILITQLLIIKNKQYKNYSRFKVLIFLFGFFMIIFSESTLEMVSNNFINNLDIILFPLFLILSFYIYFFYFFKFRYIKKGILT